MHASGTLCGGAIYTRRYIASSTISAGGIPLHCGGAATTDIGAVTVPAGASDVNAEAQIGLALHATGTVAATGVTDSNDLMVTVAVNPDLIIRARMSGGTGAGTALSAGTTTAASTGGTDVAGVTTIDDGMVWGYAGSNIGELRRADDTAGSLSINLPNAVAVGDQFLVAAGFPGTLAADGADYLDLTTDFTEINATAAITDMDNFIILDVELRDSSNDGTTDSWYYLIQNRHAFGSTSES